MFCTQIVQKPSQEKKQKLTPQSKLVADHVAKLVHSAEALKGIFSNRLVFHQWDERLPEMFRLKQQGKAFDIFKRFHAYLGFKTDRFIPPFHIQEYSVYVVLHYQLLDEQGF